jgi:hypothetical protein
MPDGTGTVSVYVDPTSERVTTDYFSADGTFLGVVYQNLDGSGNWWTVDGQRGTFDGTTQYWQAGVALGFGFGVWGTSNGDRGFGWTTGLGAYANVGEASSFQEALAIVGASGGTVTFDPDPFPDSLVWNEDRGLAFPTFGVDIGVYWIDQDPYSAGIPQWQEDFLGAAY